MQNDLQKIPRRIKRRKIIRVFGRWFVRSFSDFTIEGMENFPKSGPYIIAGNHVSSMEVLLMALFCPHQAEILGAADIPLDPNLAPFANLHGYIPIKRGSVDQTALDTATKVLQQGGVVGIFPEGGIWSQNIKQAKIGVSWISYRTKTDVIPVAFIGMFGALKKMLRFQKPKIEMRVGRVIKYANLFPSDSEKSKKEQLQVAADIIMEKIVDMLPDEQKNAPKADDLTKKIELQFSSVENNILAKYDFVHQQELSMVLTHPIIMDVFNRNLRLPVKCLLEFNKKVSSVKMYNAIKSIMNYLEENPSFLSYRFGLELGSAMEQGLKNFLIELDKVKDKKNVKIIIND